MMLIPLVAAMLFAPVSGDDRIFFCSFGMKQVEVIGRGETLTYRFGRAGQAELTLTGSPQGGVFYHHTGYARGEDQTLRFVSGTFEYVVYNRWAAPSQSSNGKIGPEVNASGLLIMNSGRVLRRLPCRTDGDLREWPVFKLLLQDEDNKVPDDVG